VRETPLILASSQSSFVLVDDRVVETMAAWLDGPDGFREAGGIFIGSYRGAHVHITDCTSPMPKDARRRALFDRKDPGHQAAAMSAWRSSGGTDSYVGEWHTHPEPHPAYSGTDRRTWAGVMRRTKHPVVFAIAGWKDWWWGLGKGDSVFGLMSHHDL
jgi:integrative and conjugative element protein (TIGR02256 family)